MTDGTIPLILSLGVFPVVYMALCLWMRRAVPNPPYGEFLLIFGSMCLALWVEEIPGPLAFVAILALLFVSVPLLLYSALLSLRARPRSRFHIAAAVIAGLLGVSPVVLMLAAIMMFLLDQA